MPIAELRFQQHFLQLHRVFRSIDYGLDALQGHEEKLRQRIKDNPELEDGIRKIKEGARKIGERFLGQKKSCRKTRL